VPNTYSWDDEPSPESLEFFEDRMREHTKVGATSSHGANRYDLTLLDGRVVKVFLTDTYEFTVADYEELRAQHPEVDHIVSASSWNHFTTAVEGVARGDEVGTYFIGEFMGALHKKKRR
jgi:hypothetical protein